MLSCSAEQWKTCNLIPVLRSVCILPLNKHWIKSLRMVLNLLGKAKQILFKFSGLFMHHQNNNTILFFHLIK